MSTDLIGWETLKKIDFQKRFDEGLAAQESAEFGVQEIKIRLETMKDGPSKQMIWGSLDTLMALWKLQRVQMIWINALREGMMEMEARIEKLGQIWELLVSNSAHNLPFHPFFISYMGDINSIK